ncbi:hypothetical protein ACFX16_013831 [Malus domestica]
MAKKRLWLRNEPSLEMPAAAQLKPIVYLARFCSFLQFPVQTRVTESSRGLKSRMSRSMVNWVGRRTRPVISTVQSCQVALGTTSWLLT